MVSRIKITFLGTSAQIPTVRRNHTAILLGYKSENILVDCGEGVQRQFRKAKLNPGKINRILITHWHGDHVLGIPGLLQTLSSDGYNKTLFVYGPKGTRGFMEKLMETFVFKLNYKIKIEEVFGRFLETDDFYLEAEHMAHGTPCNAYVFVMKGHRRIDKKKLEKAHIPSGPLLKKLKEGKNIDYKGKRYLAKDLTFKEEDKKISFILDTSINDQIVKFAKDSDILVSEASFDSSLEDRAREYKHLTVKQAAQIAKKSNSKQLILTHISQRYEKNLKKISEDAKKVFKKTRIAEDFDSFEI